MSSNRKSISDLEISLVRTAPGTCRAELRLAGSSGERFAQAEAVEEASLLANGAGDAPDVRGRQLFQALFGKPPLSSLWSEFRGQAGTRRIRLRIDPELPQLHAIPWESLREPQPGGGESRLAAGIDSPFSRFLPVGGPAFAPAQRPIRILAAVAAPDDLARFGFPRVDAKEEQKTLRESFDQANRLLSGRRKHPPFEYVFLTGPVSLASIEEQLGQGVHALHLVAHGMLEDNVPKLLLTDENNRVCKTTESDFAQMLARLSRLPLLVFLDSCHSASRSPAEAFLGIAPKAVQAGVPAVLAMQDEVPISLAQDFTRDFYKNLAERGEVDRAANQARACLDHLGQQGAYIPVLFSRLIEGRLVQSESPPAGSVGLREEAARQKVLDSLQGGWIADAPAESPSSQEKLGPQRRERQELVREVWSDIVAPQPSEACSFPDELSLLDIFEGRGRKSLLILGPPQWSSSAAVLEMVQQVHRRAAEDPGQPLPVVCDVTRWQASKLPDWLKSRYRLRSSCWRSWAALARTPSSLDPGLRRAGSWSS